MAEKTNAIRLLENGNVPFRFYEYDVSDGRIDGKSIAEKIGESPDQVFKTLVTQAPPGKDYFVFVVPASGELDLKKAAKACGRKSIEMIPQKLLFPLTGYIHGGCSPIGMKKLFPTYIDETAILFDKICVSGGRIGTNLGLNPEELAAFINAQFVDLTK
ncbi:MAG: Cys-tRNA(Pro) deacylase [Lentisphaeria bacterium]|nr:Cys-tRNA(Pro) deacylase [Lentisphaeria bacterium]MBO5803382.1 Cys-tRNA(Pro) deacylase [Lentisphaeria bacterium]MBR4884978.1 Cys-tRNA(Pro) deacylase [Lentisphaeria bacterium]